jgi:peptide/nickel transport system substrate-binding protein
MVSKTASEKPGSGKPGSGKPGSSRPSRRSLIKGGIATGGFLFGTGVAPSIAQARRDLRIGVFGGDFGNLSPLIRADIQSGLIQHNIFDALTEIDYQTRNIVPFVAESWTNVDPLTWRIKLREGMMWHRGYGEVTAEDLVYTWQFHLDSKSFQLGSSLSVVAAIRQVGKYVAEVATSIPYSAFPGISMGYGGFMVSAKAHKEMGHQAYSAKPIGNGPFMIESTRGSEIVLVRHPQYWRPGLPKLDRLAYVAVPDSNTRLQALLNNEFDFITRPDPEAAKGLKSSSAFAYRSTAGWVWDYQQFNIARHPTAPYANKLLRQAISYAIDREAIANEVYHGEATVTDNQIPEGYMGHRGNLLRYPKNGDLAKAKQLVSQAGVSGYEVEVITSDKDWLRRELELVADMVAQIGIKYKIRNLDMGGFNNLWLNTKYDQLLEDISLNGPDPDATSWNFLNGKTSRGYNNPQMDNLLVSARSEFDSAKRETLYHQIVDLTLDECPMIFHVNPNIVQIYNSKLQGFTPAHREEVEMMDTVYWT